MDHRLASGHRTIPQYFERLSQQQNPCHLPVASLPVETGYNAVKSFDFSQLPANVEYVSDTPFTEMFLDMYTQFPTAKVILTTRPSLEWAKSRKKHGKTPPPVLRPCGLAAVEDYSDKDLAGMLDAYNELVRCVVPPGNLLEINLFKHGDKLTDTLSSFLNNRLLVQSGHEKHAKSKAKAKTAKKPSA
ncbi:unnamed protein product [Symbiodinium pilosum]|uniref:Uncharacterized protein n=1 Tax=Symbiodinium pilosum TaxID=2952 RepID=A0A812VP98_SYMPI|nr:unnamed protein product [Symbiodinium pilosum]